MGFYLLRKKGKPNFTQTSSAPRYHAPKSSVKVHISGQKPDRPIPRRPFHIDLDQLLSDRLAAMKKTLYKYLIREQIVPLSVCFFGLSLILITGRLLQLTRYLFTSSLTFADLVALMAFAMPNLVLYALPMATLVGVLLAFVRLNSDNELIALRAAGIGFHQFFPAIISLLAGDHGLFLFQCSLPDAVRQPGFRNEAQIPRAQYTPRAFERGHLY